MAIFRKGEGKHALALAMTGVKLGDRLLQIGCSEPSLLGAIAAKVGLSGRACALVESEADAARAQREAGRVGALIEVETGSPDRLAHPDASFDLIVIDNLGGLLSGLKPETRVRCLREVYRALAPRGRAIVMERSARPGLGGLFRREPIGSLYSSSGGAIASLKAEGFRAVRLLAKRDGLAFFEGSR